MLRGEGNQKMKIYRRVEDVEKVEVEEWKVLVFACV